MPTKYLTVVVLIVLGAYGTFEAWPLIAGPSLSITSLSSSAPSSSANIIEIAGRAKRTAALTLNGSPLLHDQDGYFSSTLTFPHGGSILTFVATDRFGKTATSTRMIFVPNEPSSIN